MSIIGTAFGRAAMAAMVLLAISGSDRRAAAAARGESVFAPVPDDFKLGSSRDQGRLSISEFVPKNETTKDWSRMITLQILHGASNADPDAFARSFKEQWRKGCAGGDGQKLDAASDNRYLYVVWVYLCPLDPAIQKPETMWVKVISGRDALYTVQLAYTQPTSPALMGPAIEYLRRVKVCDTRLPDRPCPALKK